ncbi:MAG: hypothetical protein DLM59_08055 [Pseudonocardiales bacterium]|nr:MAG: hypothetical protein DLM59_08055 [Pseudonocardiales bacterium]
MTVASPIDQAQCSTGSPRPCPPPLRWWTPAVAFAVSAVVLSVLVIAFGTNNGPLDDPNQAFQRDGALHNGPQLPDRIGGIALGGSSVVVLFERRQPPGQTLAQWRAGATRSGSRLVVAVAGKPGTSALRDALGMRTPNDGGPPVGYAIVDRSRRVRYATLDPAYLDHASEVELLTAGLTGHAS